MKDIAQRNKEAVVRFNRDVIEKGDMAAFSELMGDDFINHTAPPGMSKGADGMAFFFSNILRPAFPDLTVVIHDQIAEDDKVATRKVIEGTHRGVFMKIEPTGKRVAIHITDIVRLQNGKYVEHWGSADIHGLMLQLTGQPSTGANTTRLSTERTVSHAPDEVYAAFADPARLAKWWGPKDFTNTFEIFEFRAGGSWKFTMHGPDGSNYRNESVFLDLVPGKKMVIQHASAPRFTLTVSLSPSETGTRVLWVQDFEDPKVAAAIRHIAEPGNEQNLDRLQMHLRGDLK